MLSSPTITRALKYCHAAHKGQIDRDGRPHYEHCARVAEKMPTEELVLIALLHDVVEDTKLTTWNIASEFGYTIADAVAALSRREKEAWSRYIKRVCLNPLAVIVKIADIQDNLARADNRMLEKKRMYEDALVALKDHLRT